jgi:hypothetical protein
MGRYVSSFLTRRITLANWQFGPVKFSTLSLGVIVGAYFADFWKPHLWLVGLVFVVSTLWSVVLWLEALKQSAPEANHVE